MPRPAALIVILLAGLALGACGSDDEPSGAATGATTTGTAATGTATAATTPATTSTPTRAAADRCERVEAPRPRAEGRLPRPRLRLDRGKDYTAVVQTNCGTLRIRLDVRDSPRTTASFVALARGGFYDDLTFHRLARPGGSDFVVQGGDPTGLGGGGPGYSVVEAPPRRARYTRGVVAMAKTEIERRGTSGSQFFVVTAADAGLPADYAILGRLAGGRDVLRRIARVPTDPASERPLDPIVIQKVTIRERGR